MAATHRAPKQWCLNKIETVNSFENWKQNLIYTLSLDKGFSPFLKDDAVWEKKSKASPTRGFIDDLMDDSPGRSTADQKVTLLELMLGQIANYCPVVSRNTIVKSSTSMSQIWQTIRMHYGFQSTGAHFMDLANIHQEADERPEDLYQRLNAFIEDNLLRQGDAITHHDKKILEDEEITPSLENIIVLTWLQLLHRDLPKLVKQRYGTELRSRTLASLKPEISGALPTLLDEVRSNEDSKVMRTSTSEFRQNSNRSQRQPSSRFKPKSSTTPWKPTSKSCPICKAASRSDTRHFLSECPHLPDNDRKFMTKVRQVANIMDLSDEEEASDDYESDREPPKALRVQVRQSPYLDTFSDHQPCRLTIDSGATGNMIRLSTATRLGAIISKSSQSAHQADGSSPLKVSGETRLILTRDNKSFRFEGLVVENLDVDILAGMPFMEQNDVGLRPRMRQIILGDGTTYTYGSNNDSLSRHAVRRAHIVRAPQKTTTLWPGDFIEVEIPREYASSDATFALEPRTETSCPTEQSWPVHDEVTSIAGRIRIPNLTKELKILKRNEQFCQVLPVFQPCTSGIEVQPTNVRKIRASPTRHSELVKVDPNNLFTKKIKEEFLSVTSEFDNVFDPQITGYNGTSGSIEAKVNMGPVQPPQRKGRVPQYARNKLVELQQSFDDLEALGVFRRPEDIGINVEYVNPSFLVKKANGGYRLVTAFADVGRYSKPQPSLMPDVDSTLRLIAQWKHIVVTDLSKAFYQIPLARDSMKYCGVTTPFRGVRVYVRSAMGMPGSETALEEMTCRVLGDLLQDGSVAKLADDLYCGGDSPEELLVNWRKVLSALHDNNLRLSAAKTIIGPRATTILGWTWELGTLRASPHRLSTLATCSAPTTVKAMRSFLGSYKVLARVLPRCAAYLAPLEDTIAGLQSNEKVTWSDSLLSAFATAQKALSSQRTITLPRASDKLWIITDGAVKNAGIGATMYINRDDELKIAGFFSAKLQKRQITWLPCEVEALSIAVSVKHFSPYIIQSEHTTSVLSDSKPCVQAYEKLCRGEFSASPRVLTFLSTMSRYQTTVRHIAGVANLPADHASRNAQSCTELNCQVCSFVSRIEEAAVLRSSIQDIISGKVKLPFTSRVTWLSLQAECPDLRRTHAHLLQGTRPSKKLTNIKDIKRYLNSVTIARDGLLVVKCNEPLVPSKEKIVVPRLLLDGVLSALHVQLDHPSSHQLKKVVQRFLYALDMDKAIERTSKGCHTCASLLNVPHTSIVQSTMDPPEVIGIAFAADVMKRERQLVLVVRECVTSYTSTCLLDSERHDDLRDALIRLCIEQRPLDGPIAIIRTDPAPGFQALVNDQSLNSHRLNIEIGRVKNNNKNPVAERAIQELEKEILKQEARGGALSPKTLAIATARLNTRVRSRGLSAREMLLQRDQFTNTQIPIADQDLILQQNSERLKNHSHSQRSKAPLGKEPPNANLAVGDIVYIRSDRNKTCARDRYLVISTDGAWYNIQKFTGTQLRNTSYRVKDTECYKVPTSLHDKNTIHLEYDKDSDIEEADTETPQTVQPPTPPDIPPEISLPPYHVQPDTITVANEDEQAQAVLETVEDSPTTPHESPSTSCENPSKTNATDSNHVTYSRPKRSGTKPAWHKDYVIDY